MIPFLIGATVAIIFLSAIVSVFTRRISDGTAYRIGTVTIAYVLSVVLFAFGSADGGPINWTGGIMPYGIAALIVGGAWEFGARRKGNMEDNV